MFSLRPSLDFLFSGVSGINRKSISETCFVYESLIFFHNYLFDKIVENFSK